MDWLNEIIEMEKNMEMPTVETSQDTVKETTKKNGKREKVEAFRVKVRKMWSEKEALLKKEEAFRKEVDDFDTRIKDLFSWPKDKPLPNEEIIKALLK